MNIAIKVIILLLVLTENLIGQEIGTPFQVYFKVYRKNLNRVDQFNADMDFNNPATFKVTIYDKNLSHDLNIFKINIYEEPVGIIKNKRDYPPLIPFRKYFLFQIKPIKYHDRSNKLTVKIDYIIDEMKRSQSSNTNQTINRIFKSVTDTITLGKPYQLTEINSVDRSQEASLVIYNQKVKPPWQGRTDRIAQYIPENLRKIDNYEFPQIEWMILHLVTDKKIEQKFWLDQMVAFPLLNKKQGRNFSFASLTSKLGFFESDNQEKWSQRFVVILIPRKVKGKNIDCTFLLLQGDPNRNEQAKLLYQKNLQVIADQSFEIEIELPELKDYRFFFYLTANVRVK